MESGEKASRIELASFDLAGGFGGHDTIAPFFQRGQLP
jgi:hypothetical protein